MARGGGRSGGGGGSRSSHSSSRGSTSGRGGGGSRRSSSSSMRSASRSYGSRSSSTHRGGAGFGGPGTSSRPSSSSSSGGGMGYGRPAPPPGMGYRRRFGGFRPRRSYGGGYYDGGGYYGGGYGGGGLGCGGCLSTLVVLIVVMILAVILMPASCASSISSGSSSSQIAQVTHTHQKLPASECDESDKWIDDRADWLDDESSVISDMRYFYKKTGSQPYLVVATDVDGKHDFTDAEGEAWANAIYDKQFKDDGHTVVAFVEYEESEYAYYIIAGRSAQSVIDQEAREIIADEINYWYTDPSLDDSEYFAKVFRESADTIMFDYEQTTKAANSRKRIMVFALGTAAVVAVIGIVVSRASKRKREEYDAARKLAETPLGSTTPPTPTSYDTASSSTSSELEDFERKYGSD